MEMIRRTHSWLFDSRKPSMGRVTRAYIFFGYCDNFAAIVKAVKAIKQDFPALKLKNEDITVGIVTQSSSMKSFHLVTILLPEGAEINPAYAKCGDPDFYWQ